MSVLEIGSVTEDVAALLGDHCLRIDDNTHVTCRACNNVNNEQQGRQCTYNVTLRRVRTTVLAVAKPASVKHSLSVFVVVGIRHATRKRHIAICDLPRSAVFYNTLPH
jgi:hypothetical protein